MRTATVTRSPVWNAPRMPGRPQSTRRGFSLIHMLVVIGMLSILMTMSGVIIQSLLRTEESVSRQATLEMTILDLSRRFRDDVHDAQSIAPRDDNSMPLELSGLHSNRVIYRVKDEIVIRESFHADQATGSEVFRMPDCDVQFRSQSGDDGTNLLAMDVVRTGLTITPHRKSTGSKRTLSIVAELGRNRRIAGQSTKITPKAAANEIPGPILVSDRLPGREEQP